MSKKIRGLCLLSASLSLTLSASQGIITRPAPMQSSPDNQSSIIQQLRTDQAVQVTGREGGWYKVSFEAISGWVRLFYVRFQAASVQEYRSGVGALFSSTQAGHDNITLTTGVRGITEKQLSEATANFEAVTLMKSFATDAAANSQFASAGRLKSQTVPYVIKKENP